jgi:hypothetical protein
MSQTETDLGAFVQNKNIADGFKSMRRYSKNDAFRANCFNSAIEHVLLKGHTMTTEEQSTLVVRFLIDKNSKENWIGEVGTNIKKQDGYDTIQKAVKEMKEITMRYATLYAAHPFLGRMPYGIVKQHAMLALEPESGTTYTPTEKELSVMESLSTERLGFIVASHHARLLFDIRRKPANVLKGCAYPDWLETMNDDYIATHFKVGEAGDKFIDSSFEPPRKMLTLAALHDCTYDPLCPIRFLYTGDLVTDEKYGAGYVEQFGFQIDTNLWIVPHNNFEVTNKEYLHPVHLIHQEKETAHFVIVRKYRMVWIEQIKSWRKDEPLFLCYDDLYVARNLKEKYIEADDGQNSSERGLPSIDSDEGDKVEDDSDFVMSGSGNKRRRQQYPGYCCR